MAKYVLDELQSDMIYRALRGDVNEATLRKTRKTLEEQKLHRGVAEVDEQLRVLTGTGEQNPGLLRIFNPQHDLLAQAEAEGKGKHKATKEDTRDMFSPAENPGLVGPVASGEPGAADSPVTWDPSVPEPRPEPQQVVTLPGGHVVAIQQVLGWDPERDAFRVVAVDGWDGHVVARFTSGGSRLEWRVLADLLEYPDVDTVTTEPSEPGDMRAVAQDELADAYDVDEPAGDPEGFGGDEYADPAERQDEQELAEGLVPASAAEPYPAPDEAVAPGSTARLADAYDVDESGMFGDPGVPSEHRDEDPAVVGTVVGRVAGRGTAGRKAGTATRTAARGASAGSAERSPTGRKKRKDAGKPKGRKK